MEHSRLSGSLGLAGFNSNLVSSKRGRSLSPPQHQEMEGFLNLMN